MYSEVIEFSFVSIIYFKLHLDYILGFSNIFDSEVRSVFVSILKNCIILNQHSFKEISSMMKAFSSHGNKYHGYIYF